MSLIPSFARVTAVTSGAVTDTRNALQEWGVDTKSGELTGSLVKGREAIKAWIWKALMTERFRYALYSWNYGSELDSYIGKMLTDEYLKTDVQLALEDTLLINEEISAIKDYSATVKGDRLTLTFTAVTTYGDVSILDFDPLSLQTKDDKAAEKALLIVKSGTPQFYLSADGRLHWKRPATLDRSLKFAINANGELIATKTEAFDKLIDLRREGEELEATYDV